MTNQEPPTTILAMPSPIGHPLSPILLFLCALCAFAASAPAAEPKLPAAFTRSLVADHLTGATTIATAPDGRVFVCEQTGQLRVVKDDRLLPEPFLTLKVDSTWERGLLGAAFDPDFPANHFVYVNYVSGAPYPHHVISRFAANDDIAVQGSEQILFEGDNQTKMPGKVKNGHQGGAIHFGPDAKLYVALGEQTAEKPSQDLHTLLGKMLRLNPDGSIPADNPFYRENMGKYRAIWCLGLRNPFCFAFQPQTGRMFINDVGGAKEEIDEGKPGQNYGWPIVEHGQISDDPKFTAAIHSYPVASITGAAFCPRDNKNFPERCRGQYFFADYMRGFIKTLDPDHPEKSEDFAENHGQTNRHRLRPKRRALRPRPQRLGHRQRLETQHRPALQNHLDRAPVTEVAWASRPCRQFEGARVNRHHHPSSWAPSPPRSRSASAASSSRNRRTASRSPRSACPPVRDRPPKSPRSSPRPSTASVPG